MFNWSDLAEHCSLAKYTVGNTIYVLDHRLKQIGWVRGVMLLLRHFGKSKKSFLCHKWVYKSEWEARTAPPSS